MRAKSEQEIFWQGEFGDAYTDRNAGPEWIASNTNFFSTALAKTTGVKRILELGANRGLNIQSLNILFPFSEISAVEINEKAANALSLNCPATDVYQTSIFDFKPNKTWDVSFTKGVLIHIDPSKLKEAYSTLYNCSSKYILVAEYYSPSPVEISYRGHSEKLFKRDFAGEIMDQYKDLELVDYGFVYRRDSNFPQDDITWFLMKK